jgi:HD-like signal output (HDOD) protein
MVDLKQATSASDIAQWVEFLKTADIPVLKHTAREVARLQADEEHASPREITLVVLNDPMMVFKVLSYAQQHKGKHQLQDLVQVEQALLMMGTTAFFNGVPTKPLVEDVLNNQLTGLTHLLKLIRRSHRAAHYAAEWAAHLMDLHAEEVRVAALLHDLAEMLMWCFAPEKMNTIFKMQQADKTLRTKDVQQEVFGFKLKDLQKKIVEEFQLPPLLSQLMDDDADTNRRVVNVKLAVNLARHSANGWDDAALPDDYKEVAALLRVDVSRAVRIIGVPNQP